MIITFTNGNGAWTTPAGVTNIDVLVVGGGGAGGPNGGGGGGGGGVIYTNGYAVAAGANYTVTVGSGGMPKTYNSSWTAISGTNSVFGTLTAIGGGGGGSRGDYSTSATGLNGGSGGGGGSKPGTGGSGTVGQGNSGGNGVNTSPSYGGGGGGGAGAVGTNGTGSAGGNGGAGTTNVITGVSVYYGGGGGGGLALVGTGGTGGSGGGGNGNSATGGAGTNGIANTGGGGGGGGSTCGSGGSGVVIVRFAASQLSAPPTITGQTNFANAFSTTYGADSAAQTYSVTGTNLTANITNTAAAGFEVSGNGGVTYGSTAIVTNVNGNASNTVYIRLSVTAPAGTYNSSNLVVLTSTGATSITNTSSTSGNVVNKAASIWSYTNSGLFAYDGAAHTPTISFNGSTGTKTTNYVGTGATTYTSVNAPTNVGTYSVSNTVATDINYLGATNNQAFTIKGPGNFGGGSAGGISVSGHTLALNVTNGTPGGIWILLQSTNVAKPVNQWQTNRTGTYDANGNLSTNIANAATNPLEFYLLK